MSITVPNSQPSWNEDDAAKAEAKMDEFCRQIDAEKARRKAVADYQQSWRGWISYWFAMGFTVLVCACAILYVWVGFIKFCIWLGRYTWP